MCFLFCVKIQRISVICVTWGLEFFVGAWWEVAQLMTGTPQFPESISPCQFNREETREPLPHPHLAVDRSDPMQAKHRQVQLQWVHGWNDSRRWCPLRPLFAFGSYFCPFSHNVLWALEEVVQVSCLGIQTSPTLSILICYVPWIHCLSLQNEASQIKAESNTCE